MIFWPFSGLNKTFRNFEEKLEFDLVSKWYRMCILIKNRKIKKITLHANFLFLKKGFDQHYVLSSKSKASNIWWSPLFVIFPQICYIFLWKTLITNALLTNPKNGKVAFLFCFCFHFLIALPFMLVAWRKCVQLNFSTLTVITTV